MEVDLLKLHKMTYFTGGWADDDAKDSATERKAGTTCTVSTCVVGNLTLGLVIIKSY